MLEIMTSKVICVGKLYSNMYHVQYQQNTMSLENWINPFTHLSMWDHAYRFKREEQI